MRIVCVSYFYDRDLPSPEAALGRYATLTDWAESVAAQGIEVCVVQRFGQNAERQRGSVRYRFVADQTGRPGSLFDRAVRVNRAVVEAAPDVVHAHGLHFARQAARLKILLPQTPLLLQDHAGDPPSEWLRALTLRLALRRMEAVSFAATEQARPWQAGGFLRDEMPIFALMEGSSRFRWRARDAARRETGLTGDPLCLWVGRLDANKDPLTVLEGFGRALKNLPEARLAMAFHEDRLLPQVQTWLQARPRIAERVTLLGCVPQERLEAFYNSADLFVLGSHHESCGYALLEALSCGVTPVVTAIPSFCALLGDGCVGALWPTGDSGAFADALTAAYHGLDAESPLRIRAWFETQWSWQAIGRSAAEVYRQLAEQAA